MIKALNNIPLVQISRFSTGIPEIDWIYGGNKKSWGLPFGKISLWSGPSGTGKSQALITLSQSLSNKGLRVLYFQNEVSSSDFRTWVKSENISPNFYISNEQTLSAQISDIQECDANIVIVDSINQLREFGNGSKKNIQTIYESYRALIKDKPIHIIFICQLDKQNEIKGGTELFFLADILIRLDHYILERKKIASYFRVSVDFKHRYGRTGASFTTMWKHTSNGAICISDNRLYDSMWCKEHGIKPKEIPSGYLPEKIYMDGGYMFMIDDTYYCKKNKGKKK